MLAYPSLVNLYKIDASSSSVYIFVWVIAHQWYWEYHYRVYPNLSRWWSIGRWDMRKYGYRLDRFKIEWGNIWAWVAGISTVQKAYFEEVGVKGLFFDYESFIVPEGGLKVGEFRLYEVDNRVVFPCGVPIMLGVTRADVIHR